MSQDKNDKNDQTVTKKRFIQKISKTSGISPSDVRQVIQHFFDEVINALSERKRIEFRHFGVFKIRRTKAKVGRNPKNPEVPIRIPEGSSVKFLPGKRMKHAVNKRDDRA